MTPHEQAIEAVRTMLSDTWYDGRNDYYSDTIPNLAAALVAQITPLLTADLQARLDAAEARERQAVEAAKNQGYVDGYAAAVSDVEVMRATDGVLAGQGLIVSALKIGLTKLQSALEARHE